MIVLQPFISNRYPLFLVESLKLEDKLLFVVKKSGLHGLCNQIRHKAAQDMKALY